MADLGIKRTMLHRTGLRLRNDRSPRGNPLTLIGLDREDIGERQDAVHIVMPGLSDLGRFGWRDDSLVNSQENSLDMRKPATTGGFRETFTGAEACFRRR